MESKLSSAPVILDTSINIFLQLSTKIRNQRNLFLNRLQSRDESCSIDNNYNTETEAALFYLAFKTKITFILGSTVKMCNINGITIAKIHIHFQS